MSARKLELALKKRQLQTQSAVARTQFIAHLEKVHSLLGGLDRIGSGLRWIKTNTPLLASVAVFFLLSRPKKTWRLLRGSWLGWVVLRKAGRYIRPALFMLVG